MTVKEITIIDRWVDEIYNFAEQQKDIIKEAKYMYEAHGGNLEDNTILLLHNYIDWLMINCDLNIRNKAKLLYGRYCELVGQTNAREKLCRILDNLIKNKERQTSLGKYLDNLPA